MGSLPAGAPPVNGCGGHGGAGALEEKIFEFIQTHEPVTYPELIHFCERIGVPGSGDNVQYASDPSFVYWVGLSDELAAAIVNLHEAGRIFKHPSSALQHILGGELPGIPMARRTRPAYVKPRWVPVAFRTTPYKKPPACRGSRGSKDVYAPARGVPE